MEPGLFGDRGDGTERVEVSEARLVIEVLSPSTAKRDRIAKAKQYAKFGVRELWIADPKRRTIEVLLNAERGFCREATYGKAEILRSPLLAGLEVPLDRVF